MKLLEYENHVPELREEEFKVARTRFPTWGVQPFSDTPCPRERCAAVYARLRFGFITHYCRMQILTYLLIIEKKSNS